MRAMLMTVTALLAGCGDKEPAPTAAPVNTPNPHEQRCVDWGVAYYKDIGSYPTLTNGAAADDEAKARCLRDLDSFPNPEIAETQRAIAALERQLGGPATRMLDAESRVGRLRRGPEKDKAEAEVAAAKAELEPHYPELNALRAKLARMRLEARTTPRKGE